MKRSLATIFICSALMFGAMSGAYAWHYAGGGLWNYGVDRHHVWSHYLHGTKCHGATAKGKWTAYSGDTRRGVIAKAQAAPRRWFADQAYYNHC